MANVKIGVIGIPGKWSTEALADEIEQRTGLRRVIDMAQVVLDLEQGKLLFEGEDLCQYDALIIKKISEIYSPHTLDRLEMLRVAEGSGVAVFSPANEIIRLIDRLACTVTLRNGNIPMPATVVTESAETALETVHRFGAAVFKPLYSTKARGMTLLDASTPESELKGAIELFQQSNPVIYIQQKLELPGRDLGMVFVAGEYLGSYARVASKAAWNSTIHSGGHYEAHHPDDEIIELAQRAQALFNLDFTTVDVVESELGPMVFEVSAFGGFRGAQEGLGINAAARYADHVLQKIEQRKR